MSLPVDSSFWDDAALSEQRALEHELYCFLWRVLNRRDFLEQAAAAVLLGVFAGTAPRRWTVFHYGADAEKAGFRMPKNICIKSAF